MFFIIFLNNRSKFLFHFFSYSFVSILWNVIFAGISKQSRSTSEEYLFETVILHLILPACLTKTCASFDVNFGRWPNVTDSLLINAIAHLAWTKDCGSSSCLADKIEPIRASQNDLKIWYPRTQQFAGKANYFSKKI